MKFMAHNKRHVILRIMPQNGSFRNILCAYACEFD